MTGGRLFTTNLDGVKQSDPALHPHEDKEKNGMEWNGMDGVCVCVCVCVCGVWCVCVCHQDGGKGHVVAVRDQSNYLSARKRHLVCRWTVSRRVREPQCERRGSSPAASVTFRSGQNQDHRIYAQHTTWPPTLNAAETIIHHTTWETESSDD